MRVQLPLLPLQQVHLAERLRHRYAKPDRRVRLPRCALGDRLIASRRSLKPTMRVRIPLPGLHDETTDSGVVEWLQHLALNQETFGSIPAPGAGGHAVTPTGRAARLKPARMRVRLPRRVLIGEDTGPRRAARSARHPVTVKIVGSNPIEGASNAEYANRQSGQAQTLVSLRVRLPPLRLKNASAGHWLSPGELPQGNDESGRMKGNCGPRLWTSRISAVTSSHPSRSASAT